MTVLVIAGIGAALFALELRQALRTRQRERKSVRTGRNLALAGMAGVVMNAIERPLAMRVAQHVEINSLGLVPLLVRQPLARIVLAAVLLDYGLYVWHVLTHKVPFLWRFHMVHHVDLDMDASTAIRFHFGEMLLSVPWRVAQVWVVGASPIAVSIWQTCLLASILFHHSNVKLPIAMERRLRLLVVTPRVHGIHHLPDQSFLNSNWSSGLAIWDLIHKTHRWSEDGDSPVGVPGFERKEQVTLAKCVTMPFAR
jgi:sterol desaturase/sphingolipid hydroxylase (fatty acid hydroxylase superfamily)